MIRVILQPEPKSFDAKVRQPGLLAIKKAKGRAKAKLPPHWTKCLDDLWSAYGGICAYMCVWIDPSGGGRSADHFSAKSKSLTLAYEWSNYRLVGKLMNAHKREFEDVLDPFLIFDGWFSLTFPSCKIGLGAKVPASKKAAVRDTIVRLKLDGSKCTQTRRKYLDDYILKKTTFPFLMENSPFLAKELERQGLRRPNDS